MCDVRYHFTHTINIIYKTSERVMNNLCTCVCVCVGMCMFRLRVHPNRLRTELCIYGGLNWFATVRPAPFLVETWRMMEKMITSLSDKLGQQKCRMAMIPFYGQLAACRPSFIVPLSDGSQMPIKIHSMSVFYLSIWALFDCRPVESYGAISAQVLQNRLQSVCLLFRKLASHWLQS